VRQDLLSEGQKEAALKVLVKKSRVYATGCLKRGREEEGEYYLGLAARYRVN